MPKPQTVATGEYRNGGRAWDFILRFHPGRKYGMKRLMRHTIKHGGKSTLAGGAFTCEVKEVK